MTAKRYTADSITDDALERVRAELERDDFTKLTHWVRGWRACASQALAAMDKTEESTTP